MQNKKKVKPNKSIQPVVKEQDDSEDETKELQPKITTEIVVNEGGKSQQEKNKEIEIDAFGFEVRKSLNWFNKQRVLVLASRGINTLGRHLMLDIHNLLPHSKKESKLEKDEMSDQINELCQINSCNNVLFFECRKKRDLYLWMAKAPSGPSVKFHIENIHTTEELKMTGNAIKGSRPLLSFDATFDELPQYKLLKEMLIHIYGTPNAHPKSKPFYDHVFSFAIVDDRIWYRNYQIVYNKEEKDINDIQLVEIGPRFVMNPIKIFEGCLNGMVLFANPSFVNPNQVRRDLGKKKQLERAEKIGAKRRRKAERRALNFPINELDEIFSDEDLLADGVEDKKSKKKNGIRNGGYKENFDDDEEDYDDEE